MFDRKSLAIGLLLGVCLCLLAALLSEKQEAHAQPPRTAQQPPPPIPLLRVRRLEIVNEQGKVQAEFYTVTE